MSRLPRELEQLDKMLVYVLGRRPDEFGLVLAEGGWLPVKRLLQALHEEPGFSRVRAADLERLAALVTPPRLEVDGESVRSLDPEPPELRRDPGEALPSALYLAISPKIHTPVWDQGLKPPPSRELVLARTPEMARRLGKRRANDPILVTIHAQAAARGGLIFQPYGEELFLVNAAIPREFLQLPTPPKEPIPAKPAPKPKARPTPGTVELDLSRIFSGQPVKGKKRDEPEWKKGARAFRKKRGKD
ncbi:MAG: RNA 2'-phosphotransferase [Thermodesulfobacteriota bacterium]